jgi:hypothetical protein
VLAPIGFAAGGAALLGWAGTTKYLDFKLAQPTPQQKAAEAAREKTKRLDDAKRKAAAELRAQNAIKRGKEAAAKAAKAAKHHHAAAPSGAKPDGGPFLGLTATQVDMLMQSRPESDKSKVFPIQNWLFSNFGADQYGDSPVAGLTEAQCLEWAKLIVSDGYPVPQVESSLKHTWNSTDASWNTCTDMMNQVLHSFAGLSSNPG